MLSDEEKEALEILNNIEWDGFMITIKNLIEKQSKEIEEFKNERDLLKEQLDYVVNEYGATIEKQDKIINEMAEWIERYTGYNIDDELYKEKKNHIIEYFLKKVGE